MSIVITSKQDFGQADYGWLKACYHFSFANYYHPDRMGFGVLRVVNDDCIAPESGFDTHPHRNMEIITYVKTGAITHTDSQGNKGRTEAGNIQVMSAGSGVYHSEYNHEKIETTLYQIWIEPNQQHVTPCWKTLDVNPLIKDNQFYHVLSGTKQTPLHIYQDADMYMGRIKANNTIKYHVKRSAYILIVSGKVQINEQLAIKGDSVACVDEETLTFKTNEDTEVIVLDV